MRLCRYCYAILGLMLRGQAVNDIGAMTLKEIFEAQEKTIGKLTLEKRIKLMESEGYIALGPKLGKAKTYLLTELGIEKVSKVS